MSHTSVSNTSPSISAPTTKATKPENKPDKPKEARLPRCRGGTVAMLQLLRKAGEERLNYYLKRRLNIKAREFIAGTEKDYSIVVENPPTGIACLTKIISIGNDWQLKAWKDEVDKRYYITLSRRA